MNLRLQIVIGRAHMNYETPKPNPCLKLHRKKKNGLNTTKLTKIWILKYPRQLHVLERNFEF